MENNNKLDNLTTLEWELYHILKERSKEGLWTSQEEVMYFLQSMGYDINSLRPVRQHIYNIRHCNRIQKIIISSDCGYKILTNAKEEKMYLDQKFNSALKKLKQAYRDYDRLKLDGQMKLTLGTQDREFFESVLKENE